MTSKPIYINAASGFCRKGSDANIDRLVDTTGDSFDLETRFDQVFDNRVRRASRYVKFSNLAAKLTLEKIDRRIFATRRFEMTLGTGVGNLHDVVAFGTEIVVHRQTVMSPGHFVNTVSNAGLFYVARDLGIDCVTSVVSQESVSFESALFSAVQHLRGGVCDIALVGGVDVLHEHHDVACQRFNAEGARPETIGEGAGFLLLSNEPLSGVRALGAIVDPSIHGYGSWSEDCAPRLREFASDPTGKFLSLGIDHDHNDLMALARESGLTPFNYRDLTGDFPTGAAVGIQSFLFDHNIAPGSSLLHLNQVRSGPGATFAIAKL